jgi:hypothetical protein
MKGIEEVELRWAENVESRGNKGMHTILVENTS